MSIYPSTIQQRSDSPEQSGHVAGENASGKSASFVCGSFVRFSVRIDSKSKTVAAAGFESNGCGFMVAAADVLTGFIAGRPLADLHGLDEADLERVINDELGVFEPERQDCGLCCITALRSAFVDYRKRKIEEFRGEKALICTCFSVTEETLEYQIDSKSLRSVDEVTRECNAGGGCGSCRMLIQEMIDNAGVRSG